MDEIKKDVVDKNPKLTFPLYAAIWYNQQNWKIPDIHLQIFDYLEDEESWGVLKTKSILIFRGCGKSTITDLWVAYKLTQNPALRFLILSADSDTATKSTNDVLAVLKHHPMSKHLIDTKLEVRRDSFKVVGHTDARNASCKSKGISSNLTAGRADYIIYDDIEVPRNCGTEGKRRDLRRRVAESNNLLVPEMGRRLFIGTYHDPASIYDEVYANGGCTQLKVPLIKNIKGEFPYQTGESQWPERFNDQWIANKQRTALSKSEWLSQYLLIPASTTDSILDISKIISYSGEIDFISANGSMLAKLGETTLRSVSCWWDPSMSTGSRDDSVLAIVFSDDDNNFYIHRVYALVGDADVQCTRIKHIALEFNIPVITIENNGIGSLLPALMIKHLERTGIAVSSVYNNRPKNERIVHAFETALYSKRIHAHESVMNSKFVPQLRDFSPSQSNILDDYIDSVASAILNEPIRIAAAVNMINNNNARWMSQGTYDIELVA
jgi:hypothetical protein